MCGELLMISLSPESYLITDDSEKVDGSVPLIPFIYLARRGASDAFLFPPGHFTLSFSIPSFFLCFAYAL